MKTPICGPWAAALLAAALAGPWPVAANAVSDATCTAGKNLALGRLAECRHEAEARLARNGDTVRYAEALARCEDRLLERFANLEAKALERGVTCPTYGDAKVMANFVSGNASTAARALAGLGLAVCGNGIVEAGEECDWANLGGATCSTASGGYLSIGDVGCTPGTCTFDLSDCHGDECPGALVGGACWIKARTHQDCYSACGEHRRFYDDVTQTYAGDLGTNEHCNEVLDALGVEPAPLRELVLPPEPETHHGLGCGYCDRECNNGEDPFRMRVVSPPTSPEASLLELGHGVRMCACH